MVIIGERLRNLIIERIQDGATQKQVSRELKICQSSVRKVWIKFLDTGSVLDKKRSGRHKKCSEKYRRLLCRQAKKEPILSAQDH